MTLLTEKAIARIEYYLDIWQAWMHTREYRRELGYPKRSAGLSGGGGSDEFDDVMAVVDSNCARAMDAIISDLGAIEQAAIHHTWLHAVYRARDLQGALDRAYFEIAKGMRKRGLE